MMTVTLSDQLKINLITHLRLYHVSIKYVNLLNILHIMFNQGKKLIL